MDSQDIISVIIQQLPSEWLPYAVGVWSVLVTVSNLILIKWKPPSAGDKLLPLYKVVQFISLSKGYNTSAFQPSATALMLPPGMDREATARRIGLEPATTDPKYKGTPCYALPSNNISDKQV